MDVGVSVGTDTGAGIGAGIGIDQCFTTGIFKFPQDV